MSNELIEVLERIARAIDRNTSARALAKPLEVHERQVIPNANPNIVGLGIRRIAVDPETILICELPVLAWEIKYTSESPGETEYPGVEPIYAGGDDLLLDRMVLFDRASGRTARYFDGGTLDREQAVALLTRWLGHPRSTETRNGVT